MSFFDDLRAILPNAAAVSQAGGGERKADQSVLIGEPDLVRRAVDAIPNSVELFPDYDSYIKLGAAIKAAFGDDTIAAEETFLGWCERSDWFKLDATTGQIITNTPEQCVADFRRIKAPFSVGIGWLTELADSAAGGSQAFQAERWFEDFGPLPEPTARELAATAQASALPLRMERIGAADLERIPPRQWLYGTIVSRGYVTFLASPGGVGKTAFVFALALACAAHKRLLQDTPRPRALRVWIMNLEDDKKELRRRMAAALRHFGLDVAVLENIGLNSGRDRRFRIVKTNKDGDFVVLPDHRAVIEEMRREAVDMLVIDPVLRSHGVSENENEAQDEVMRLYAEIAEKADAGVVLVHHTRKGAEAGSLDSLRGGSTQGGGARSVITLAPMSADEAGKLGIAEDQRRLYVRVDDAKNNMAPPGRAQWIKLESVSLGNGDDEYPAGDSVQVATRWDPPSAWDGMLAETEAAAVARIDAGMSDGERYSGRIQDGERWAGRVLVEQFDKTEAQARELIEAWLKTKTLEAREYHSGKQRKTRKGLFRVSGSAASVFD
jgi:hypothetical protein